MLQLPVIESNWSLEPLPATPDQSSALPIPPPCKLFWTWPESSREDPDLTDILTTGPHAIDSDEEILVLEDIYLKVKLQDLCTSDTHDIVHNLILVVNSTPDTWLVLSIYIFCMLTCMHGMGCTIPQGNTSSSHELAKDNNTEDAPLSSVKPCQPS